MPVILLPVSLPAFLVDPLRASHTVTDTASPAVRGLLISGGFTVHESLLTSLPNLEIISVFGVGYDGVPVSLCQQRGIRVTNTH